MNPSADGRHKLGQGRSGVVYRLHDQAGREVARKIFVSDALGKLVHYVLGGAPNPYIWSEDAIRCAVLRRRLLDTLLTYLFEDGKVSVARAYAHRWNDEHRAFEMDCQFIAGRHVALHHPFSSPHDPQLADVLRRVMKPLQRHLAAAGFDGLVWQAGRGNPVALNNFLCLGPDNNGGYRWAWIDLESGVPALFPANPLQLLGYYLPRSFYHRRPLFDDVDLSRLERYLAAHDAAMRERLGPQRVAQLRLDAQELAIFQRRWKSLPRYRRGIAYRLGKGHITPEQADYYHARPCRWYAREARRAVPALFSKTTTLLTKALRTLANLHLGHLLMMFWMTLCSQAYRTRWAKQYVAGRIDHWERRRQFTPGQVRHLRQHLEMEEATSYLPDLGVHLAMKPAVKITTWVVLPAAYAGGLLNEWQLALLITFMGAAGRTLHTLYRIVQNTLCGRERPWVALGVGLLPSVGNAAYPLQILTSGQREEAPLAQFIIYDTFTSLGRALPIWGGPDSLTEHVLNRLPLWVLRRSSSTPATCTTTDSHHAVERDPDGRDQADVRENAVV